MTTDEKIRAYCKHAVEQGWKLKRCETLSRNTMECCPLGAVAICENLPGVFGHVEKFLGITNEDTTNIIRGFDGNGLYPHVDCPYYELGQSIAEEYGA